MAKQSGPSLIREARRECEAVAGPHARRIEVLSATPTRTASERSDGLFVVSGLPGRFRSMESAQRAAARQNAETWLRLAVVAAPEAINLRGHIDHFARYLVENAGMSRKAAAALCEEWASDESRCYAARAAIAKASA